MFLTVVTERAMASDAIRQELFLKVGQFRISEAEVLDAPTAVFTEIDCTRKCQKYSGCVAFHSLHQASSQMLCEILTLSNVSDPKLVPDPHVSLFGK